MSHTLVANIRHYLDENQELIQEPGPARRVAQHLCAIVEATTARPRDEVDWDTGVRCRRRPGHKPCQGNIVAGFDEPDETTIRWMCPLCGDNGYISGWQETQWDKSAPGSQCLHPYPRERELMRLSRRGIEELDNTYTSMTLLRAVDDVDALRAILGDDENLRPPEIRQNLMRLHQLVFKLISEGYPLTAEEQQELLDLVDDIDTDLYQIQEHLERLKQALQPLMQLYPDEDEEFDEDGFEAE